MVSAHRTGEPARHLIERVVGENEKAMTFGATQVLPRLAAYPGETELLVAELHAAGASEVHVEHRSPSGLCGYCTGWPLPASVEVYERLRADEQRHDVMCRDCAPDVVRQALGYTKVEVLV